MSSSLCNSCSYDFNVAEFDAISCEGKGLVSSLLVRAQPQRLTAAQALAHPWLRDTGAGGGARVISTDNLR